VRKLLHKVKEEYDRRTDEYDHPSENRGLPIFGVVQPPTLESLCCLDYKKALLVIAAECVVVETLGGSIKSLRKGGREDADIRA